MGTGFDNFFTGKMGIFQFLLSEEFFESNYFQIGQACSPVTY